MMPMDERFIARGGTMNIGVIGGGATGLLVSSYLQKDQQVTVYVKRKEQKNLLEEKNVHLYVQHQFEKEIRLRVKLLSELEQHDCIIVCVKQHQLQPVLAMIKDLPTNTSVIFLQNGMGHVPLLEQIQQRVIVGVIEHGVSRLNDYTINHLGSGVIKLAPYSIRKKELEEIIQLLQRKDFPFRFEQDWRKLLQDKLIVNVVINPLTALFNVNNGAILTNERLRFLAERVCYEAAKALDMDEVVAWEKVEQTATITKGNTSSMRADLLAKRKTEIDAITGYILRLLPENEVPYNTFLYNGIVALEIEGDQS